MTALQTLATKQTELVFDFFSCTEYRHDMSYWAFRVDVQRWGCWWSIFMEKGELFITPRVVKLQVDRGVRLFRQFKTLSYRRQGQDIIELLWPQIASTGPRV